jgi:hypothetical protein
MIFFGIRLLSIDLKLYKTFLFSILFCFSIEILQLVKLKWLITIRNTTLGHYVLGAGFLWLDLVCYIIGAFIAYKIDTKISSSIAR